MGSFLHRESGIVFSLTPSPRYRDIVCRRALNSPRPNPRIFTKRQFRPSALSRMPDAEGPPCKVNRQSTDFEISFALNSGRQVKLHPELKHLRKASKVRACKWLRYQYCLLQPRQGDSLANDRDRDGARGPSLTEDLRPIRKPECEPERCNRQGGAIRHRALRPSKETLIDGCSYSVEALK